MDEPGEDGVSQGGVTQASVPVLDGHLVRDEGGLATVAVVEDVG